jgi:competence protein ComEC
MAAQFRVEMRLLAETVRLWTRLPERASCLAMVTSRRACCSTLFQLVRGLGHRATRAGAADGGLLSSHRIFGRSRQCHRGALMCAVIPVGFIAIFTGWVWVAKAAGGCWRCRT